MINRNYSLPIEIETECHNAWNKVRGALILLFVFILIPLLFFISFRNNYALFFFSCAISIFPIFGFISMFLPKRGYWLTLVSVFKTLMKIPAKGASFLLCLYVFGEAFVTNLSSFDVETIFNTFKNMSFSKIVNGWELFCLFTGAVISTNAEDAINFFCKQDLFPLFKKAIIYKGFKFLTTIMSVLKIEAPEFAQNAKNYLSLLFFERLI